MLLNLLAPCEKGIHTSVIGPRKSSTLRTLIDSESAPENGKWKLRYPNLDSWVTKLLKESASLYLATPRVMDEVLLADGNSDDPRAAVIEKLEHTFKNVRNFAATDSQLASEILNELQLRGFDPTDPRQHLAIVSESDSFYGRMLSMTYAAEMARKTDPAMTRQRFVRSWQEGDLQAWPRNLVKFSFFKGLDGQSTTADTRTPSRQEAPARLTQGPSPTLENLKQWVPDANKAEGAAQLDYLSRMGGRIEEYNRELLRSGEGSVKAIGIIGADIYDTLLILQAMRSRFPNVIFFTTELDARMWHPEEWRWTRNLVVTNGYGLTLHEDLQGEIAPFRDATQTAQFAAAMSALGVRGLDSFSRIPVRRFEIGRKGPVDLSVDHGQPLHPLAPWQKPPSHKWFFPMLAVLAGAGIIATLLCRHWRWLTVEARQHIARSLWFREEDIGGVPGFRIIAYRLSGGPVEPWKPDPTQRKLMEWLKKEPSPITRHDLETLGRLELTGADLRDPDSIIQRMNAGNDPLFTWLKKEAFPEGPEPPTAKHMPKVLQVLNRIIKCNLKPTREILDSLEKSDELQAFSGPGCKGLRFFRRRLWLEENFPADIRRPRLLQDGMRKFLESLNDKLWELVWLDMNLSGIVGADKDEFRRKVVAPEIQAQKRSPFLFQPNLNSLRRNRQAADRVLDHLLGKMHKPYAGRESFSVGMAAACARMAGLSEAYNRLGGFRRFWGGIVLLGILAAVLAAQSYFDGFRRPGGEAFSLISGTSSWPSLWLLLLAGALSVAFLGNARSSLRTMEADLTRRYRLPWLPLSSDNFTGSHGGSFTSWWKSFLGGWTASPFALQTTPIPLGDVDTGDEWVKYQELGSAASRLRRILPVLAAYIVFALAVMKLGEEPLRPVRGTIIRGWEPVMQWLSGIPYLILAFGILDAIRLCRWLIERLSEAPTRYPAATLLHFQRTRGGLLNPEILNEWLDLQLIAEMTERIGKLLYYPFIVFFIFLLSRNSWWDSWSWSGPLIALFTVNLILLLGSAMILQRAARRARDAGLQSLLVKVDRLRGAHAKTRKEREEHEVSQAEALIDEIRNLKTGAFASFWQNPILGALLLPSGGTAAIQLFAYLMAP